MVLFKEQYAEAYSSSIIATTAAEVFNVTTANADKHGSANSLTITSLATEYLRVDLDNKGLRGSFLLAGVGANLVITPEDGIFFNSVRITNVSATNTSADEIKVRFARAIPIATPQRVIKNGIL